MSRTETGTTDTEFHQSLTRDNNRLRNLHDADAWNRPQSINVRGHQLVVENPDAEHPDTYELQTSDGDTLGSIELSHFEHKDDLVRFVNAAIQHGFEAARDWARDEPTIGGWWSR